MTNESSGKTKEMDRTISSTMDDCKSIEQFTKKGLSEVIEATKCANALPQGSARDLYCTYPTFNRIIEKESYQILGLISQVLKWQNVRGNIQRRLPDEQFELLLECNDGIFERLQNNLDEMAGIKKNSQTIVLETLINNKIKDSQTAKNATTISGIGSWNMNVPFKEAKSSITSNLIIAKTIPRPQLKFRIPVDNSPNTPFIPKLKEKPNSLKPLCILPEYDESGNVISYLHPYEFELMKFEVPEYLLDYKKNPQFPKNMESTELMYVQTLSELKNALEELRQATVLAVDVEHHSYRSFLGITCLVQISTTQKDYIFDALELRDDLHILNEVLTDSKIVKIFHGADLDIEWLQRDLSLYIVNMFDTHQAAKALNFARLSLAYLLKHFCDMDVDKTYQLADWRIRPLPLELLTYARQDTHYLIYIYECLNNDLLNVTNGNSNLLRSIFQRSTEICKKRYNKPIILPDSHMDFYRKSKKLFDNRQLFALEKIFEWRDATARQEDESFHYVLPSHMMLQMAESLPREMQGILACCNPIPPIVKQQMHTLHQIILKARDQPLVKPIYDTETIHRQPFNTVKDYDNILYCPHDLTSLPEFRDDLPTLFTFDEEGNVLNNGYDLVNIKMPKPQLSTFNCEIRNDMKEELAIRKQKDKQRMLVPYYRYLAMLPIAKKEKLEEIARLQAEKKTLQLCPTASPCISTTMNQETDEVDEDNIYKLPIKEMLKRKHEKSQSKKMANLTTKSTNNVSSLQVKRNKTDTFRDYDDEPPIDNKVNFLNSVPTRRKFKLQNLQSQEIDQKMTNMNVVNSSSDSNDSSEEKPTVSSEIGISRNERTKESDAKKNKKKSKFKRIKPKSKSKSFQASNKPVNTQVFDYSKVDFSRFKGGAQKVSIVQMKSNFHGKVNSNKKTNNKFNKMFTFSNVNCNKK